jgi:hypothetical protein
VRANDGDENDGFRELLPIPDGEEVKRGNGVREADGGDEAEV